MAVIRDMPTVIKNILVLIREYSLTFVNVKADQEQKKSAK